MIVGFGGGGIGILPAQTAALLDLLKRLPIEGAVHRGSTGIETMIHNHIRSVYPSIPVHVVPILGVYSVIASMPQGSTAYKACSPDVVNDAILRTVWGLVFLPERMTEGGLGWDLPYEARHRSMPIIFIWPTGETILERNDL